MNLVTPSAAPKDWRARIRDSRTGTLLVLVITTALVMGGSYLIGRPKAGAPGVQAIQLLVASDGVAPRIGAKAPDFVATSVAGKELSISSYKGEAIWLTFGASWCAACQAEFPDIENAYIESKAGGVVVLGIFIREEASTVLEYVNRIGLTFPIAADSETRIAAAYRVNAIPTHFFIDRTGVIRSIIIGSMSPVRMKAAIAEISR